MKRTERKIVNYFKNFDHLINEDYKKLYDKYKNLKLSHNRKYKLLERIETNLKILNPYMGKFEKEVIKDLLGRINEELTFVGRVRERWGK